MKKRRRGLKLEMAILEAAWNELVEIGYTNFTVGAVAARAGTSRSVLKRRWDSRITLAVAAIHHQLEQHPIRVEDLGDMRRELLALMDQTTERATGLVAGFALFMTEFYQTTGSTPEELRSILLNGEDDNLEVIFERAVQRGELRCSKIKPHIIRLPFDLLRHHVLMTQQLPTSEQMRIWIDEVFLPLVELSDSQIDGQIS